MRIVGILEFLRPLEGEHTTANYQLFHLPVFYEQRDPLDRPVSSLEDVVAVVLNGHAPYRPTMLPDLPGFDEECSKGTFSIFWETAR